jgi:ketosteroid isomerase-like protein
MGPRLDDESEVRRLDDAWNDAYVRHDRSRLADVLADAFEAVLPSGERISRAELMVDPPGRARSVEFSERTVQVFGDAAVSRGRLRLTLADRYIDQRFMRVWAKQAGQWRAVAVAVTPVPI